MSNKTGNCFTTCYREKCIIRIFAWNASVHASSFCMRNLMCYILLCMDYLDYVYPPLSLLPSLPQTVNQRVWRLTRSRQHSSHTPRWRRLDAGLSRTTSFLQRKSWQCGKRTLRALVIAHPQINRLNPNVWAYLDLQTGWVNRHRLWNCPEDAARVSQSYDSWSQQYGFGCKHFFFIELMFSCFNGASVQ